MEIQWKMKKVMTMKTVVLAMAEVSSLIDISLLILWIFSGVELHTNEYASRHEENRLTATTKDHNIKRKLEVILALIIHLSIENTFTSFISHPYTLTFSFRHSKMNWVMFKILTRLPIMIVYINKMSLLVEINIKH